MVAGRAFVLDSFLVCGPRVPSNEAPAPLGSRGGAAPLKLRSQRSEECGKNGGRCSPWGIVGGQLLGCWSGDHATENWVFLRFGLRILNMIRGLVKMNTVFTLPSLPWKCVSRTVYSDAVVCVGHGSDQAAGHGPGSQSAWGLSAPGATKMQSLCNSAGHKRL